MIWTIIVVVIVLVLSARWNWWRFPAPGIPILMYHKIGTPPANSKLKKLWVSELKFENHLKYLKKKGYQSITLAEIAEGKKIPLKPVIITFDDGYQNNYQLALPLLKKYGFFAVFFIVTDTIEQENVWHNPATEQRILMMSRLQIQELIQQGHEIGSHTCSHPNLALLDEQKRVYEIMESKKKLEQEFHKTIRTFSYPYGAGALTKEIQDIVRSAGYTFACSIRQGKADINANRFFLKRLLIRGDDIMFDFYLNLTRGKGRF